MLSRSKKLTSKKLIITGGLAIVIVSAIAAYGLANRSSNLLTTNVPANPADVHAYEEVSLKNGQTYDLTAGFVSKDINGKSQTMLAYNGSIPGPVFKVTQGDKVKVVFKNEINIDSTIHAHGLRQDFKMDGMVGMSQSAVKTGGSFTYDWSFPDPGVYWYHPHVREDYEQGSGMYGVIIVAPKDTNYWPASDNAQPIVLSDVLTDPKTNLLVPFTDKPDHTLMGRYGNIQMINGKTDWEAAVKANTVQRLYISNASNARPYRFAIDGVQLKVVGSDNGRVGNERMADALTIGPGERYIVDILFTKPGKYAVKNIGPTPAKTLGLITVSDNVEATAAAIAFSTLRTNQDVVDSISQLNKAISANKTLVMTMSMSGMDMGGMDHGGMMGGSGSMTHAMPDGTMMDMNGNTVSGETAGIEWSDTGMTMKDPVNWQLVDNDTNKANQDVNWTFKKGDVVLVTVTNSGQSMHPMQHQLHFHGQRFAVITKNGQANKDIEWKDTVTIPTGQTYELLVSMDNPGDWMAHCHIAEHLSAGMAINFSVRE